MLRVTLFSACYLSLLASSGAPGSCAPPFPTINEDKIVVVEYVKQYAFRVKFLEGASVGIGGGTEFILKLPFKGADGERYAKHLCEADSCNNGTCVIGSLGKEADPRKLFVFGNVDEALGYHSLPRRISTNVSLNFIRRLDLSNAFRLRRKTSKRLARQKCKFDGPKDQVVPVEFVEYIPVVVDPEKWHDPFYCRSKMCGNGEVRYKHPDGVCASDKKVQNQTFRPSFLSWSKMQIMSYVAADQQRNDCYVSEDPKWGGHLYHLVDIEFGREVNQRGGSYKSHILWFDDKDGNKECNLHSTIYRQLSDLEPNFANLSAFETFLAEKVHACPSGELEREWYAEFAARLHKLSLLSKRCMKVRYESN